MAIKVNRSEVPLLVIGLGGTGKDAALAIKKKFQERFNNLDEHTQLPERTAFLVLDADNNGIGTNASGLLNMEYHDLSVPNIGAIFTQRAFSMEERQWINPELSNVAATTGAGGVRQLGRFQLFRNIDSVVRKLQEKLNSILLAAPNTPPETTSLNVLICSSLSGGTGSGTTLDMAYIVRQVIQTTHAAYASGMKLYGMCIMPENIIAKANGSLSTTQQEGLQANAFAAMKEIDYWMRQELHHQAMTVRYSGNFKAEWNIRPFSYLYYLGHSWENGVGVADAYQVAINKVAELMLMLSVDTPQVQDGTLIKNNIYSDLSNIDQLMNNLQGMAPYPVSVGAVSIGTSEFTSDEAGIAEYEKNKTITSVMAVSTFNSKSGEPISIQDAQISGVEVVNGLLSLPDMQDKFFDELKIGTQPVEEYEQSSTYPINDSDFTKEAVVAAGGSYSGLVQDYYQGRLPACHDYFKTRFAKMWENFILQAKACICNIQCGPVCFLHFLDEVYLPDLNGTLDDSTNQINTSMADIGVAVQFCDEAYDAIISTKGLKSLFGAEERLQSYRIKTEELSAVCWTYRLHQAKQEAVRDYRQIISSYRDNLALLIDAMKKHVGNERKPESDMMLGDGALSFDKLKSYLDSSNLPDTSMKNARDEAVAKARDQVMAYLADESFALPREKQADTHQKQVEMRKAFVAQVNAFVEECFAKTGLDNMDNVLAAAVQGQEESTVNYMAAKIAPNLANAARPMLALKTNPRNNVKDYAIFDHTSVPKNANDMQNGLQQFQNGGVAGVNNVTGYTSSDITDRMMHLHLRFGIPMYMMSDAYKLMGMYEKVIASPNSDQARGIHLVDTTKSFNSLRAGSSYTIQQTWRKLPLPIPPVEIEAGDMSDGQRDSVKYLEELLEKAVQSGIIVYTTLGGGAPYDGMEPDHSLANECFRIHSIEINGQTDAISNMDLESIKLAIDEIAANKKQDAELRLEQLRKMRLGQSYREIVFGSYMEHFAAALNLVPIVPKKVDSLSVRRQISDNYLKTRHKLCAYMLSLYPESLDLVEKQLEAFSYLHEHEQVLADEVDKKNRVFKLADSFCMLLVTDVFKRNRAAFGVNNAGSFVTLFTNDFELFTAEEAKAYEEAAFLMQYDKHVDEYAPGVPELIQNALALYPADANELDELHTTDVVKLTLDAKVESWKQKRAALQQDLMMNTVRRAQLVKIYDILIKRAGIVQQQLLMD